MLLRAYAFAVNAFKALRIPNNLLKGFDNSWIKMLSRFFGNIYKRIFLCPCLVVRTVARGGIPHIKYSSKSNSDKISHHKYRKTFAQVLTLEYIWFILENSCLLKSGKIAFTIKHFKGR